MISDYSTYNEYDEADVDNCYLRYRRCQASTLIRRSHALIAEGCAEHLYMTRSIARLLCDGLDGQDRLCMVHNTYFTHWTPCQGACVHRRSQSNHLHRHPSSQRDNIGSTINRIEIPARISIDDVRAKCTTDFPTSGLLREFLLKQLPIGVFRRA